MPLRLHHENAAHIRYILLSRPKKRCQSRSVEDALPSCIHPTDQSSERTKSRYFLSSKVGSSATASSLGARGVEVTTASVNCGPGSLVLQEPTADSSEPGAGASSAATTLSGMIDEDRIAETQLKRRRVRRMCSRQRAATSQWWRDSLQRYAQRRMWMHLGPPKQGQLPERFVRIHEVCGTFSLLLMPAHRPAIANMMPAIYFQMFVVQKLFCVKYYLANKNISTCSSCK